VEQRTIRLNFDVSFVYGPRTWRAPLVAALLLCAVGDLNSESVTLSTYYPAPSGVYTNMITTGNTVLARDGGAATKVGIGTTNPGGKLAVSGSMSVGAAYAAIAPPADGMIVSGRLGIGNAAPSEALDVAGNVSVAGGVGVVGNVTVTAGGGARGYVKIDASGCSISNAVANGAICAAGYYATFQPGVYTEGTSYMNLPAPFLIGPPPTYTRLYKFVGIDPLTGQQSAMSTGYTEAIRVSCCPKT
jgi:hypothetical protein